MKKKAFVPIGNFRWLKPSAHVPENSIMPVYKKLRLNDIIKWKGSYVRIDSMIDNHPLDLWNMIYNKEKGQNSISLENRAYKSLKSQITRMKPELIEDLNNKKKQHKDLKNLKHKINNGKNVYQAGRFKKIGSRKVIE